MTAKRLSAAKKAPPIFARVLEILESARANVARTVNSTQVVANWLIGREIVEEEQQGSRCAGYGEALLADLAQRLLQQFGKGWSVRQLEYCRSFYLSYPLLLAAEKSNAVRAELAMPAQSWQPGQLNLRQSRVVDHRILRPMLNAAPALFSEGVT